MTTRRMLPPPAVNQQTRIVNGRTYTGAPGTVQDILDTDAMMLSANGWVDCGQSGPTGARPTSAVAAYPLVAGVQYVDTTLNAVIRYDGSAWRNVLTGASV
jgi:hypothetical protein